MKEIIGIIAVILTFVGYVPYIRDTLKGKTKPHVYTWLIWGLVSAITFALQMSDNAGPGAFVNLAAASVCILIVILGFKQGDHDLTTSDTIFFVGALLSLGIWLIADQPVISVLLISVIEHLGFIPTIRKSWNKPYSETLITYEINTFRFSLAILAIENYSIITTLSPVMWMFGNGFFAIFLIARRRVHDVK